MAGLRFAGLQSRPMEFLDFTSLTLDEFQLLVPPFEAAFQTRMAVWRMDGKPRTARRIGKLNGIFAPVSPGAHPRNPAAWTQRRLCVPLPAPAGRRAGCGE